MLNSAELQLSCQCTVLMSMGAMYAVCSLAVRQWTVHCWGMVQRIISSELQSVACVRIYRMAPLRSASTSRCVLHSLTPESASCSRLAHLLSSFQCLTGTWLLPLSIVFVFLPCGPSLQREVTAQTTTTLHVTVVVIFALIFFPSFLLLLLQQQ